MPQFTAGSSHVAENRRKYMNPGYKLEKLRDIEEEDVVRLLAHRAPGEEYMSIHPPLEEMEEPECSVREMVEPTEGAKAGDRIRCVQFTDSMQFAPITPRQRALSAYNRYRGVDIGVSSGGTIIEARERDIEKIAKELIDSETFDTARTGLRGRTVDGHAVRLDANGMMFDALRRGARDERTGEVTYVKDMIGGAMDKKVKLGNPLTEDELRKRTTMYRNALGGVPQEVEDPESMDVIAWIHWMRTVGGFQPWKKIEEIKGGKKDIGILPLAELELKLTLTGFSGTPFYMRNILNTAELFIASCPATVSGKYGFHSVVLSLFTGFDWKGDFYDDGLPGTAIVKQVLAGGYAHLAFVRVERPDAPAESGVRVYRTAWCQTPPIQFVRQLHSGEKIVAMGNDPLFTTLVSEEGIIYVYRNVDVNCDVELDRKFDLPRYRGITVKRAIVLSHCRILIEEEVDGQSRVFFFKCQGAGGAYYIFGVPTAPTQNALGERYVELKWYVGQSGKYGLWASLVITGNDEWLRIYYYPGTGREYRLVKFMDTAGTLHDRYTFPEGVRDWDLRFSRNENDRVLNMLAANEFGVMHFSTVELTLGPSGQSYFQVKRRTIVGADGDVCCVFWALDYRDVFSNPRFEIHRDGRLRFAPATP